MKYPLHEVVFSTAIKILTLGMSWVFHQTHVDMVKQNRYCNTLAYASFRAFKRNFKKIECFTIDKSHPNSLFTKDNYCYLHASIFRFGDTGFILSTYGFIMASIMIRIRANKLGVSIGRQYIVLR